MEQIRAFVAIELPPGIKSCLKTIEGALSAENCAHIKWVDPENIHLTLKFLGNVPSDRLTSISQAVQTATRGVRPFELRFSALGAFPSPKKPQIVWVGLEGAVDALQRLYRQLEDNFASLGFPREGRPFTPHLTLARVRDPASFQDREKLGRSIGQTSIDRAQPFRVDSLSLMRSVLSRTAPVYSRLESAELI